MLASMMFAFFLTFFTVSTKTLVSGELSRVPTIAASLDRAGIEYVLGSVRGHSRTERETRVNLMPYHTVMLKRIVADMLPQRVRREVSNDTDVAELNPWKDDLKNLRSIFEDMKRNPELSFTDAQAVDDIITAIENKHSEIGELITKYRMALFAAVVHPSDKVNIGALEKILKMINKVNSQGYTIPIFRRAAHAVNGLYAGNIQNMVIIKNLQLAGETLQAKLGGRMVFDEASKSELDNLRLQVTQARNRLSGALQEAGLSTSNELNEMKRIDELAADAKRILEEALKLARNTVEQLEETGATRTVEYGALRNLLRPIDKKDSSETSEEDSDTQGDGGPEIYCRKDIWVERNEAGDVVKIGDEYALKRVGLMVRSRSWFYDHRGDCVIAATEEEKQNYQEHNREKRSIRNQKEGMKLTDIMKTVGNVVKNMTLALDRERQDKVFFYQGYKLCRERLSVLEGRA